MLRERGTDFSSPCLILFSIDYMDISDITRACFRTIPTVFTALTRILTNSLVFQFLQVPNQPTIGLHNYYDVFALLPRPSLREKIWIPNYTSIVAAYRTETVLREYCKMTEKTLNSTKETQDA